MSESRQKPKILFACAGNTCRSVLAEYLTRHRFSDYAEPNSAGLRPQVAADAENAVYTLSQIGIDAKAHQPQSILEIDLASFDYIVAMDPSIARELRSKFDDLSKDKLKVWKISDPYGDDLAEYNRCAQQILAELKRLFLK